MTYNSFLKHVDLRSRPDTRFPRTYKLSAGNVCLSPQTIPLKQETTQNMELLLPSFTTQFPPRALSSWAFSFIRTFIWDGNMLHILRNKTEKRSGTEMQELCHENCTQTIPTPAGERGMKFTTTERWQNPSSHRDSSVKLPYKKCAGLLKLKFDSLW